MEVIRIFEHDDTIANMIALFRVELGTYKSLVKSEGLISFLISS